MLSPEALALDAALSILDAVAAGKSKLSEEAALALELMPADVLARSEERRAIRELVARWEDEHPGTGRPVSEVLHLCDDLGLTVDDLEPGPECLSVIDGRWAWRSPAGWKLGSVAR